MFKKEITKVVMDNDTFKGTINMSYKAGYTKGWLGGIFCAILGGAVIAAYNKRGKEKNNDSSDDEVI